MSAARSATRTVQGADGVPLAVLEEGPPSARPIVLAHGVGSSARFVVETFGAPLRTAGLRLVTYDLRGHGRSGPVRDPAGHAFALQIDDLHAVVTAVGARLAGGVSLGGHAAVGYAARGGVVDAVVACLPAWTGRAAPGEGPHAAMAGEVTAVGVETLIARFRDDTRMRPWLRRVLVRDWSAHDPESLRAALVALDGALAPTDAELSSLPVPLGVVGWPEDPGHPLETARSWAERAPRGHLVETTLGSMDEDVTALGRAAVAALVASGIPLGEDGLRRA